MVANYWHLFFKKEKRYFWQILLVLLSKPRSHKNQCFYTIVYVNEVEVIKSKWKLLLDKNNIEDIEISDN